MSHPVVSPAYVRTAGAGYLLIAFAGAFSIAYVPAQLIVPGDPAASMQAIADRLGLFMAGLAGDTVMMLTEIVVTVMLYQIFRRVDATVAGIAALARFAMVGVMAAMLFFHAGTLALIDQAPATAALEASERTALAGLLLYMHDAGVWIWQLFFAMHLVLLGWLVARSAVYPRVLGLMLMVGAFGYLADTIHAFALPDSAALGAVKIGLLVIVTLAELGFALTLLIRPRVPA